MSNHLGNVLTVINDIKVPYLEQDNLLFKATIVSTADYSPFGVQFDGRTVSAESYRYGYQGSEKDDEVKGSGNSYTTEFRLLDPRLGRWLSIDPLADEFPWQSPYCSMDNNPINLNDVLGLSTPIEGSTTTETTQISASVDKATNTTFVVLQKTHETSQVKGNIRTTNTTVERIVTTVTNKKGAYSERDENVYVQKSKVVEKFNEESGEWEFVRASSNEFTSQSVSNITLSEIHLHRNWVTHIENYRDSRKNGSKTFCEASQSFYSSGTINAYKGGLVPWIAGGKSIGLSSSNSNAKKIIALLGLFGLDNVTAFIDYPADFFKAKDYAIILSVHSVRDSQTLKQGKTPNSKSDRYYGINSWQDLFSADAWVETWRGPRR
jgi:RHS repeat-associated protein